MTCKYCGEPLSDTAKFCENCGHKVESPSESTAKDSSEYKEPERVDAEVVSDDERKSSDRDYSYSSSTSSQESESSGPIGYSIASLVCGILGILCCCCSMISLVFSVAGIALGIIAITKNCDGKGMAIAGIACGGAGAFLVLISFGISIATRDLGLQDIDNLTNQLEDLIESL